MSEVPSMDLIPAFVCLECPRLNDEMLRTGIWWKQHMITVLSSQFSAGFSWAKMLFANLCGRYHPCLLDKRSGNYLVLFILSDVSQLIS